MSRPLKIALVAPLIEAVPPKLYGGTERIVAYLADSLVCRGHEVTLFATGRQSHHRNTTSNLALRSSPVYYLRC
jgi:hypothetical protein